MMFMAGTRRAKVNWSSLGFVCMALAIGACGGDLPPRYYYGGPGGAQPGEHDGGMCVGRGRYSCGCADEPYVLAVSLALANSAGPSAGLSDLDVDFFRQAGTAATPSANAPAKGTPGADGYFVASVLDDAGGVLTTLVFKDPRLALGDAGYPSYARARLVVPLPSGADSLRIENWGTGQVLIDLDLRGRLQLLCIDRPCLSVCQSPAVDATVAPAVDAGAADIPGAADSEAVDAVSGTSLDAGASD